MSILNIPDEHGKLHRLGAETVLVFIDETGTDDLSDPIYPIFGLGGCCVPAHLYASNISRPWLRLKDEEFEGQGVSLHAADVRKPSASQLAGLNSFFTQCIFGRFAAVISDKTAFEEEYDFFHITVVTLLERVRHVLSHKRFSRIFLILEDSQRSNAKAFDFFSRYHFEKNAQKVSITRCYMSKSEMEPGLEVADFVIHCAGTSVRDRLTGKRSKEKERPDFLCVFKGVDSKLSSFLEITRVTPNESD